MKALILAGGSGTRLWPLSRRNFPKQFLPIEGPYSLLQDTVLRLKGAVTLDDCIVLTNSDYRFHVKSDMEAVGAPGFDRSICEPASRNTAPAIALGVAYCRDRLGCGDDEVLFISPSDHIIRPGERFAEYVRMAAAIARQGHLVTFGIKPDRPETGYGYIKAGARGTDAAGDGFFSVERFTEKPSIEMAREFIADGSYYWNSGMFAFTIGAITAELQRHAPAIADRLAEGYDAMLAGFPELPDISIDYAVMEKSDRVVTLPLDLYWNDIGSWDAIYDVLDKDAAGNVAHGDVTSIDTRNCLIMGNKRLVTTLGLEDCLVIETEDALLVAKRGETQKVKELVQDLKARQRREVEEHVTTYRPWGSYTVLEEGPRYKIKRIVVNPAETLSLQMHYHRSEHWVVVKGAAKVTIGDKEILVHENESVYVPKSTTHRLANPGKVALEIIEVQNGEYVGEDDIVRFDDRYGRESKAEK